MHVLNSLKSKQDNRSYLLISHNYKAKKVSQFHTLLPRENKYKRVFLDDRESGKLYPVFYITIYWLWRLTQAIHTPFLHLTASIFMFIPSITIVLGDFSTFNIFSELFILSISPSCPSQIFVFICDGLCIYFCLDCEGFIFNYFNVLHYIWPVLCLLVLQWNCFIS